MISPKDRPSVVSSRESNTGEAIGSVRSMPLRSGAEDAASSAAAAVAPPSGESPKKATGECRRDRRILGCETRRDASCGFGTPVWKPRPVTLGRVTGRGRRREVLQGRPTAQRSGRCWPRAPAPRSLG
jgi:hypothetical protein